MPPRAIYNEITVLGVEEPLMLLSQLLDVNELHRDINEGLINVQTHSLFPLKIFNYSHKAAFTEKWSQSMTICRGLIVDSQDNVLARPFAKFWNYADPRHPETMPENLPLSLPELTIKQDGSLLIGAKYGGQTIVSTRGSFISEQAKWAQQKIDKEFPDLHWPEGWTPVWEMIAGWNQIVVNYGGWEGFFALALIHNTTGEEANRQELEAWATEQGFPVTPLVNKQLEECAQEKIPNFEGYVAKWPQTGKPPLRVKIKLAEYCQLHRILTGLNPKAIWELLSKKADNNVYLLLSDNKIPEDFKAWLSGWVDHLSGRYEEIESRAQKIFSGRPLEYDEHEEQKANRKAAALYFTQTPELCSILFSMLDGADYSDIIWRMIRPKATDTFKAEGE